MSTKFSIFPALLGADGPQGPPGLQGPQGPPGNAWYENEGPPGALAALPGDLYLDLGNGDIWLYGVSNWGSAPIGNIEGPQGPQGPQGPPGIATAIDYFHPLSEDIPVIPILITSDADSFKVHIKTFIGGAYSNPPDTNSPGAR